jgi:hypothetical protein
VLVIFISAVTKYLKEKLKEGKICFAHVCRGFIPSWQGGHDGTAHIMTDRKQSSNRKRWSSQGHYFNQVPASTTSQ